MDKVENIPILIAQVFMKPGVSHDLSAEIVDTYADVIDRLKGGQSVAIRLQSTSLDEDGRGYAAICDLTESVAYPYLVNTFVRHVPPSDPLFFFPEVTKLNRMAFGFQQKMYNRKQEYQRKERQAEGTMFDTATPVCAVTTNIDEAERILRTGGGVAIDATNMTATQVVDALARLEKTLHAGDRRPVYRIEVTSVPQEKIDALAATIKENVAAMVAPDRFSPNDLPQVIFDQNGDVRLKDPDGTVHLLDVASSHIDEVADAVKNRRFRPDVYTKPNTPTTFVPPVIKKYPRGCTPHVQHLDDMAFISKEQMDEFKQKFNAKKHLAHTDKAPILDLDGHDIRMIDVTFRDAVRACEEDGEDRTNAKLRVAHTIHPLAPGYTINFEIKQTRGWHHDPMTWTGVKNHVTTPWVFLMKLTREDTDDVLEFGKEIKPWW